jgi:hypothetical protein
LWSKEFEKNLRRERLYNDMQKIISSRAENNVANYWIDVYLISMVKIQMIEVEQSNEWENIVAKDNKFCFEKKVWKQFLSNKPTIMMNDEWVKLIRKGKMGKLLRKQEHFHQIR